MAEIRTADLMLAAALGGLALFQVNKRKQEEEQARVAAYYAQLPNPLDYGCSPVADANIWAPGDIGGGFSGGRHH
jgi:hypothetical protein